jgi:hypothetical protein
VQLHRDEGGKCRAPRAECSSLMHVLISAILSSFVHMLPISGIRVSSSCTTTRFLQVATSSGHCTTTSIKQMSFFSYLPKTISAAAVCWRDIDFREVADLAICPDAPVPQRGEDTICIVCNAWASCILVGHLGTFDRAGGLKSNSTPHLCPGDLAMML